MIFFLSFEATHFLHANLFSSGTKDYACPEYFKTGKYYGRPATVYSLGVVLFALVTGTFPRSLDLKQINEKTWYKYRLTKGKIFIWSTAVLNDRKQKCFDKMMNESQV